MKSITVIITAGGVGKRMGTSIPKQFLEIKGTPILELTISRMSEILPDAQLLITLPESAIESWREICIKRSFSIPHTVIAGGKERFHSVLNALRSASNDLVLVHDGVRPFFSKQMIINGIESLSSCDASVPVIDLIDSLREKTGKGTKIVDRKNFMAVQTPQFFKRTILKKAYEQPFSGSFTDDASVVESIGIRVETIDGNTENIKITNPLDVKLAEMILSDVEHLD